MSDPWKWCEKHQQWRHQELGGCRGCGKRSTKNCALKPQVVRKRKRKLAKKRKV